MIRSSARHRINVCYKALMFITVSTTALNPSLFRARLIKYTPDYHTALRSVLLKFSHLRPRIQRGHIPSCFPTRTLQAFFFSTIRSTFPAHPTVLYIITRTTSGQTYRSQSPIIAVFSTLFDTFLSILFSNTRNLYTKFHTHTKQRAEVQFPTF